MAGKAKKSTKKFVKNHLKRELTARRQFKAKKAVIDRSKNAKAHKALRSTHQGAKSGGKQRDGAGAAEDGDEDEEDEDEVEDGEESGDDSDEAATGKSKADKFKGMSVDDFLGGGFKEGLGSDEDGEEESDDEDSMADIDELSDDDEAHAEDLAKLAERDPEFYKYLQENDKELLNFGEDSDEEDEEEEEDEVGPSKAAKGKNKLAAEDEDEEMDEGQTAAETVTDEMLRGWQKSMLKHRSLRALRRLLLAFRAAARMDEESSEGSGLSYVVESAAVFNKLLLTTLKYTPVVLQHHIPYKEQANGKYKLPTNTRKFAALQRPIATYFSNLHHLLRTLPEPRMQYVALSESAKMVPYLVHNRRAAREYVKILLNFWSTAEDNVRIAAFLGIRKVATAGDEAMLDLCLKGVYHSFVRSTKLTTVHTLPSINLMKNSASEMFALDTTASFQHAFGFIRQLAIHLRNCLKMKTKEAYKSVYNWQYVHCLDFWSLVLATACDADAASERGESSMQPLIYPLVQVALGVIRLIPTSRYYPLRLHVLRSLLRLIQRTHVYVPLSPLILEMFESAEFRRKPKGSTLKPLELDTTVRAPASYVRTRVYADQLAEEGSHILLEYLGTQARSIAFPEMVVPTTVQLKRGLKTCTSPKLSAALKHLLDKVAQNSAWIEKRREGVEFAPKDRSQVDRFLENEKAEAPLEAAVRLARKVREQKRKAVETARQQIEA